MRYLCFFLILILFYGCSKPQAVLICGDHICVNKTEAEQYFEENLSLEVKIINKGEKKELSLVELNLDKDINGKKEITIFSKKNTNTNLKTLSENELIKIKKNIKNKKKNKKITKKIKQKSKTKKNEKELIQKKEIIIDNMSKKRIKVTDICTILKKCSIDEISKYLTNQGIKKDFPDITQRQ